MKEVKITIPDNCELVKEGDSYVIKEKKKTPPKSWKEFCENYPIAKDEVFISETSYIRNAKVEKRTIGTDKNYCINQAEAEAFLALMQLRQLRNAWVGEYRQVACEKTAAIKYRLSQGLYIAYHDLGFADTCCLSFPDEEMAKDFLSCFRDLCETAKILL